MTSEDKKKVEKLIERYKDEYFHHLCQLINFESTYGHELEAQLYLKKILEDLQMEIDIFEPDLDKLKEHSAYLSARQTFNGSPNLVGVWKGTGGGRSLLLNGHIDVVPAGDLKQWSQPPFMAINNGHSISGRGATDMKGGTISLLLALKVVQEMKVKLKGDVIFQSVIDEECGGAGTLAAILRGYQADAAVIPEPTKLKVFPLQQGSMWFRIKVTGRAAHGGTRYEGVSAIDKAIAVIEQLKKLETLRNERINHPLYQNIPIPIPINIGKMNGGDWPSSVPDEVMIEGRYGVSFDETMEEAKIKLVLNGEIFHGIAHFPSETFVTGFFANELRNSIGVPVEHEGEQYALFLRPDIKLHFSEMHYLFAWLLGFTIVFSLILEMTLAHYLIRPLSKLNQATKAVQKGEFDVKLDFKRQDEIGELATSFQDMTKQLAEAEDMRNEFISSISHDIQSPLSNINGYTSLLENKALSTEEKSQHLQVIRSETERLSSLTSQLLVLSSLNQMEQPRHKENFSLSEQVKSVIKGYQWKLSEKEILLQYHLSEVEFTGDRAMCMSVWDNLMSNAIKYNHQGGEIRIELKAEEHHVLLTIEDTGIGLTELEKERMFERFYRADPSRTMEIEGAGLGLAIVKKVVDLHSGELKVHSKQGKGTSITVILPII